MPFKLSFPDLARRLARGLGIIGKTPVSLDETAVQTVLIRDLTLPEFARIPVEWATFGSVGPVVAQFSIVGVRCEIGVLVVTGWHVRTDGIPDVIIRINRAGGSVPPLVDSRTLFVLNRPQAEQEVTPSSRLTGSDAAVLGFIIENAFRADADDYTIVLFPGEELLFAGETINTGVDVHIRGKQYPPLR